MVKHPRPVATLLTNNNRPIDAMGFVADLLRNVPNLARIGGAELPIIAPAGGRPMESAMIEFLGFLSTHYLSTSEDRGKAQGGSSLQRRPGQRFDVDAWIRHTAVQLKWSQAELSCRGKGRIDLVNKYLARSEAGRLQHLQGIDLESLKEWRKSGPSGRGAIWSKETAAVLTSFFVPPGLEVLDPKLQQAHLIGLAPWADSFFTPYLGDRFPVAFFSFFLDFSQHSLGEIGSLTASLRHLSTLSIQERVHRIQRMLAPAVHGLSDLIGEEHIRVRGFLPNLWK